MPDSDEQIREEALRNLDGDIHTAEGYARRCRETAAIADEQLEALYEKRDALRRKSR